MLETASSPCAYRTMVVTDATPLVVCLVLFVVACIALAVTAAILYRRYNALLKLCTEKGSVHATVSAISPSSSSASTPQRDNSPAALLHRRMNSRSSEGGLSVSILEAHHGSEASDMSGGGSPRTPSFGSEYSDSSPTTRTRSAGSIFQRESAMRKDLGAMLEQATADIAALQEVGARDGGASSSKRSTSAESRSGGRGRADSLGSLSTTLGKCLALFSEADSWDSDQQMEKRILTRRVSDNALNAQ